ncbi:hypothetical protein [Ideonella sp.]|uniref:DUF6929 family protein n=1 Tax=Ideonella sp. TaxID=1929293 RepID=UPI0035B09BDE
MIHARLLRHLDVSPPAGDRGCSHLSAASGLVRIDTTLYVVADDELSLGVFDLAANRPGRLVRLVENELPTDPAQRKAAKPDFEALTTLPAFEGYPFGCLLALGSGSRANRQRAVLWGLDARGQLVGAVRELDMAPLYEPLRHRFADLNLEGAFVAGGDLCLLQRGHRGSPVNACVRFAWQGVERWLCGVGPVPAARSLSEIELGGLDGVPLCLTDGAALSDGSWVFCAAAEDTSDAYADGRCMGSAVGVVSAAGDLMRLEPLAVPCKAEGIALASGGPRPELLLVTDADDRRVAAQLLSLSLP